MFVSVKKCFISEYENVFIYYFFFILWHTLFISKQKKVTSRLRVCTVWREVCLEWDEKLAFTLKCRGKLNEKNKTLSNN